MNPRTTASWLKPDQARRQLREWATNPLRIRRAEVATVLGRDGTARQYPLVEIAHRADIADFIRRHALDGDGDGTFTWKALMSPIAPSFASLKCEFVAPVRKVFSLQFDLRRHIDFLQEVAVSNTLVLTTGLPNVLILQPVGLDLRHMLAVFLMGELLHQRRGR